MREIVLDTETTGLNPGDNHRIVEIGCIELENYLPTGRTFQAYINPERDMPEDAFNVHGLSQEFLQSFPCFKEIAGAFLEFIGKDQLVIHNARFDMRFLNAELALAGLPEIPFKRAIDTLMVARQRFPGASNSLDALCRRFRIDNSNREFHGALLDSQLLADVYIELRGGRQPNLISESKSDPENTRPLDESVMAAAQRPQHEFESRTWALSPEKDRSHRELLKKINNPVWDKYLTS